MAVLIAAILSQILASVMTTEVILGPGQAHRIHQVHKPTKEELILKTAQGYNVKISCDDFRLPARVGEDPCTLAMVKFDDGTEEKIYCKTNHTINERSAGNQFSVVLDLPYGAYINCLARSTQEPTGEDLIEVKLEVNDGSYVIERKSEPKPYADIMWKFRSTNKLSARCTTWLREPCDMSSLSINDGEGDKMYCGKEDVNVVSKGNWLNVRVTTDKYGEVKLRCVIQSVTGPHADQLDNMISEEVDSSEHGVTRGRRSTSCNCGWVNKGTDRRVLNGKTTKEGEYPYMVTLSKNGGHVCGGSIITPIHVLTAAHCVLNHKIRTPSTYIPIRVIVGGYDLKKVSSHGHSQKIDVKEWFIRKEWMDFSKQYDVSVLLLQKEIKYSQFVGPVCLPNPAMPYKLYYERIKVTGWGLNENYVIPDKLKTTRLFVLESDACTYPTEPEIVCTISRTSSPCEGDSGGPLVYLDPDTNRYTQVSLVSYGFNKACKGVSGSSNVTYHLDWIKEIVDRTSSQNLCTKI